MADENKGNVQQKGHQKEQLSYEAYQTLKTQQAEKAKKKKELPKVVKIILALPFIIIFLFGLLYIPYLFIVGMMNSK
ncbi:MAG: hypothetical protein ABIJ41_05690 [Candidatus Omnitrophota bacterium]